MSGIKTAVVTGGAGFVGSHLCRRLASDGYRVISLDNYFTGSTDNHVEGVEYRVGHTKDIAAHIPESADLIYHLGEYSRVEVSLSEPQVVWDLNVSGTLGVLEWWRAHGGKLIYAGSSTKFGDGGRSRDQTPYAWSKAANISLITNYHAWFGLPYAITYFYNVYGPGERAGKYGTLIEIFRQQAQHGGPLTVTAPGAQRRNFTHVDDIVEGLIVVGLRGEGDGFGLGSDESFSVKEVAEMFSCPIEMGPERAGNRMDSTIDTSKSKALGWKPTQSLPQYITSHS